MFKKSKPQVAPPSAPTVEEMLSDMETFDIITQSAGGNVSSIALEKSLLSESGSLALGTWWEMFDVYDHKIKKLTNMKNSLEKQKQQLEECKAKLERTAKRLRDGLETQQKLIKEVIDG
ncbi:CG18731 [Drosophila busckii]|uniref:CG18731 n=1 Tax=Drosophila busckii TaxID=30019 RepID=A0A0M4EWS4_DROBS|nr:uncharacterized protein LOC108603032 [Drosophila busckii]ALC48055.1 CG18731 [Drosophila busckii]